MFQKMLWIESRKIFRQPVLWIELAILALAAAGIPLLLYAIGQIAPAEAGMQETRGMLTWPGGLVSALNSAGASGLGGMLIVILAGSAITQEYQWRTLHFWLSRGVPRGAYLLARFASLLAPALLLAAGALAAGGLSTLVISIGLDGTAHIEQVNALQAVLGVLRAACTLLPYAALALLLGTATRSPVATIGVGIAFTLLVENVLAQILALAGGPLAGLVRYLPMVMAKAIMEQNAAIAVGAAGQAAGGAPILTLSAGASLVGLALYTLVFLGLAFWQIKKQDLAG